MRLIDLLAAIQHSWLYWLAIVYFAAYPMVTSVLWITTSMFFRNRWEKRGEPQPLERHPSVSVLIPAHNEERVIANAIAAATAIDYPDFEIEQKATFYSENAVCGEVIMSGTQVHSSNPAIPATGKPFSARGAYISEWQNGKIKRHAYYQDMVTVMQQLGLMPTLPKK